MVKIIALACTLALLAGCASQPASQALQALPAAPTSRGAAAAPILVKCYRLDPTIATEAVTQTSLAPVATSGVHALSAALMASEARKNAALQQAIKSYEFCRSKLH